MFQKKKILIVDDEEHICRLIPSVLQPLKCTISSVSSAKECLALFKVFKPDLMIVDIMMPNMSGLELVKEIRAKGSNVKIIFLTVLSEEKYIAEGRTLGAIDYITKPFHNEDVLKRVKKALAAK